jgi:glycosyltransferase involved in cell wall biosynthesis
MKILFIHNYYQYAGGEDNVVAAELKLLADHGHQVELWSVDNKDLPTGLRGKISTALNTTYSTSSKVTALAKLQAFKPDVVHVHNFFPQLSPSIYDACLALNIPVVQTLHNYRLMCPGAMLMRQGKICEQCIKDSPYQAVLHGCYKGSKLGSLVVAHMVATHRKLGTWQHKVSRFIALTEFAKDKFIEAGFPADKMVVKPNFVNDPFIDSPSVERVTPPFGLFVGRLSVEKGLHTLLKAWALLDDATLLKVAGTGPLAELVAKETNVEPLGLQSPAEISLLMQQAAFLVLSSEWYEGFPLVLVEALAHGLPILASNLGSMAAIIKDGETGLLFEPGNAEDLATKVKWLLANPDECTRLGVNARLAYLDNYTPEENVRQLLVVYQHALLG